jgi:hypothetical protein
MHSLIDSVSGENLRLASRASRAEQFSLWALRLWWRAFPELETGWSDFLHGFRVCGVQGAVEPCHRFCAIMLSAAGCGSGVACIHFPRILPTEEQLLSALEAGTTGEHWVVEATLRTFAPATAARAAAPFIVDYAQILAQAGISWPGNARPAQSALRARAQVCVVSSRLH